MRKLIILISLLLSLSCFANNTQNKSITVYKLLDTAVLFESGNIEYTPTRYTFSISCNDTTFIPFYKEITNSTIGYNYSTVSIFNPQEDLLDTFTIKLYVDTSYNYYVLASEESRKITDFLFNKDGFIKFEILINKQVIGIIVICGNYVDN